MTKILKIDESDLDNFVTNLLKAHVDGNLHGTIWNNYQELKHDNENTTIIIDSREDTASKLKVYKEKVDKVFQTLAHSIEVEVLSEYQGLDDQVTSCNLSDKTCVNNLICILQKIENKSDYTNLKISFHLGFLFTKLKKSFRSVKCLIDKLNLQVSRQYVQDKISLFTLLKDYPRLQSCKISPNYLKINRKIILEEIRFREDHQFWQNQ